MKKTLFLLIISSLIGGCSNRDNSKELGEIISQYQTAIKDISNEGYEATDNDKCRIIEIYCLLTQIRDSKFNPQVEDYIIQNAKSELFKIFREAERRKKVLDAWQNNNTIIYLDKKAYDAKLNAAIQKDIRWNKGLVIVYGEYDTKELPYFFDCSPREYIVKNGVAIPCSYEEAFKAKHVIDIQMTNIQSDH